MPHSSITPGWEALRALSHPGRLRILGLLRMNGPTTATALANRLGLNTGQTSYHLRQLAKHGLIEEDTERGNARDRWWRARHDNTQTSTTDFAPDDLEAQDSIDAYMQAVAIVYADRLQQSLDESRLIPEPWQRAGTMSDWQIKLTPERARELSDELVRLVSAWAEEPDDDEDSAQFTVNINTFLTPGQLSRDTNELGES